MIAAMVVTLALLSDPGSRVDEFYCAHLPHAQSGLPDAERVAAIRDFLSDGLHAKLIAAIRYREEWRRRYPDEPSPDGGPPVIYKPPCVEGGDYFEGLSEWPDVFSPTEEPVQTFRIVRSEQADDAWRVRVAFRYETIPPVVWENTVIVIRERDRYVIDDVLYEGDPAWRLSQRLIDCAKD